MISNQGEREQSSAKSKTLSPLLLALHSLATRIPKISVPRIEELYPELWNGKVKISDKEFSQESCLKNVGREEDNEERKEESVSSVSEVSSSKNTEEIRNGRSTLELDLPPESSGTMQTPLMTNKHEGCKSKEYLNINEERLRAMNIPITVSDIINLPSNELNEQLSNCGLTQIQLSLIGEIRRKTKNKFASRKCRKRKLEKNLRLENEINEMRRRNIWLTRECNYKLQDIRRAKEKLRQLYRHIFQVKMSDKQQFQESYQRNVEAEEDHGETREESASSISGVYGSETVEEICNILQDERSALELDQHLLHESSGTTQTPLMTDKQTGCRSEEHLNINEKMTRVMNVPITVSDIINLPSNDLREQLSKYDLSNVELSCIWKIRKRGHNRLAAQNCRKRKLEKTRRLTNEMKEMRFNNIRLTREYNYSLQEIRRVKEKFSQLNRQVKMLDKQQFQESYQRIVEAEEDHGEMREESVSSISRVYGSETVEEICNILQGGSSLGSHDNTPDLPLTPIEYENGGPSAEAVDPGNAFNVSVEEAEGPKSPELGYSCSLEFVQLHEGGSSLGSHGNTPDIPLTPIKYENGEPSAEAVDPGNASNGCVEEAEGAKSPELKNSCSLEFVKIDGDERCTLELDQHLPPESSGTTQTPLMRVKRKGRNLKKYLNVNEKSVRAMNIPITVSDIINLPRRELQEQLSKCGLSQIQLTLIRHIRRQGHSKLAQRRSRKFKLQQTLRLRKEVKEMRRRKIKLIRERNNRLKEIRRAKEKFSRLYRHIFQHLRDPAGNEYSPYEYSLLSANGSVFLVPHTDSSVILEPESSCQKYKQCDHHKKNDRKYDLTVHLDIIHQ